jgi:hypothetical protein
MPGPTIRKSLGRYIAELTVVVFGVTIAFMVDDWAEKRRDHKYEIEFLDNIQDELTLNLDLFHSWENYFKELTGLFEDFYRLQQWEDSSLAAAIKYRDIIMASNSVKVYSSAWETTKASSGLRLIRDVQLKNQLSTLYSRWFPETERVFTRLDNYKSNKLIPYYNDHRAGRDPSFINSSDLNSPEIYNIIRTYQVYHSVLADKINYAEEKTGELIELIDNYITKYK